MIPHDWLAPLPAALQAEARTLDATIRAGAPSLAPEVTGAMLGYGPFRYRYDSGREGTAFLVTVAARKHGWSVYVNAVDGGGYLAEQAGDLGKVKVGRSCVKFKTVADVDLDALERLVAAAVRAGGAGAV
ncbi:MAG: DUF1801 domain-containing protein [Myxococcota bacterium]